jgi:hypothetical protein
VPVEEKGRKEGREARVSQILIDEGEEVWSEGRKVKGRKRKK